jgi:hypothetical protein
VTHPKHFCLGVVATMLRGTSKKLTPTNVWWIDLYVISLDESQLLVAKFGKERKL